MKIIHIIRGKADPGTMNGVNGIVHHLATEQAAMGRDVEVWGLTGSPGHVRHQHDYPLRLFPAFGFRIRLPQDLQHALAALSPDDTVAHFHSVFVPEFFALSRALERRGIEWVQSPHGGYAFEAWRRRKWRKQLYFALFERHLLRGAAAAQATGKGELGDIAALAPRLAGLLIPNGQEILERAPATLTAEREIVFGYCGRLVTRHKGLDLLLEGFALYRRQGGQGALRLIGDGPDRASLEQLARTLGLSDRVAFVGAAFGDDKIAQLCQLDAVIHCSRWEGLAMTLLEASSLGIPVIVSEATNFGDYVRQFGCGVVLETNDASGIASALHHAAAMRADGTLEQAGRNGRNMIAENFSWRSVAERVEAELYGRSSSAGLTRADVLTALFAELEGSGIPYVAVGDVRRYPQLPGGDVDLVFDQAQIDRATRLVRCFARRHGLHLAQVLRHEHSAYYVCLAWMTGGRLQVIKLDYCGDYLRDARRLMQSSQLLVGRTKRPYDHGADGGLAIPAAGNAFLYYLMKRLDKKQVGEAVASYLSQLWAEDEAACRRAFLTTWPDHCLTDLATVVRASGPAAALDAAGRLRLVLHRARPIHPADWLRDQVRKAQRFMRPTGLFMAVVGPDGAGKSSVIAATTSQIAELFRRQQLDHMRPGVLPKRKGQGGPVTDPHAAPPYGGAASMLKLAYLVADYILGFLLKVRVAVARSTLVTFDRYYHDIVADPLRWRYGGPPGLPAALGALVPLPDVSLVLDAPAETIHARKAEVSLEACQQQVIAYRSVARSHARSFIVDVSRPLPAVVEDGVNAVLAYMVRRIRRRHE